MYHRTNRHARLRTGVVFVYILNKPQVADSVGESAARLKHGFESRWGHHIFFCRVSYLRGFSSPAARESGFSFPTSISR